MPTILFAEDKPSYNHSVTLALRAAGFDVVSVENGQDAIDMLNTQKFDLVLTDFCMPFKNGGDVAKTAKQKGIRRIIINSAMSSEIDPIDGIEIVAKMTAQEAVQKVQASL